jgi:hypothetical protein
MKFLLLAVIPALGLAAENSANSRPPTTAQVPGDAPFGLTAAQQLADARRRELHGECGLCIFKERIGEAWVFRTLVGYAGSPAPDITVFPPAKTRPPAPAKNQSAPR